MAFGTVCKSNDAELPSGPRKMPIETDARRCPTLVWKGFPVVHCLQTQILMEISFDLPYLAMPRVGTFILIVIVQYLAV